MEDSLRNYIEHSREAGVHDEEIERVLRLQGWTDADLTPFFPIAVSKSSISTIAPIQVNPLTEHQSVEVSPKEALSTASFLKTDNGIPASQESAVQERASNIAPSETLPQPMSATNAVRFSLKPAAKEIEPSVSKRGIFKKLTFGFIVLLFGAAVAYAYIVNVWPFNTAPYSNAEALSKGLAKMKDIHTGSYKLALSFKGMPRDDNAKSFSYDRMAVESAIEQARPAYERDKNRFSIIQQAVSDLQNYIYRKSPLPLSLSVLAEDSRNSLRYGANVYERYKEFLDGSFAYERGSDGKTYKLTVKFETNGALAAVERSFKYMKEPVLVSGKTISFNEKNFYPYVSFSAEPPAPPVIEYLKNRDQILSFFPNEVEINSTLSGTVDFGKKGERDAARSGSLSVNGSGVFGDATYAFGLDARVVDDIAYLRINKFPSFPGLSAFFDPSNIKGVWVRIAKGMATSSVDTMFPVDFKGAVDTKNAAERAAAAYAAFVAIINEENLVTVGGNPSKGDTDGATVYTYAIFLNKEKLVPVYKRTVKEVFPLLQSVLASTTKEITAPDPQVITFLESDLFKSYFDYIQKNQTLSVSFTKDGFFRDMRYKTVIIPLDDSKKLAGREYELNLGYTLFDINKPITVEEPADYITIDAAVEKITGQSLSDARSKGKNTAVKTNLSSLRLNAELYFDEKGSYGPAFPKAVCPSKESSSLFGSVEVQNIFKNMPVSNPTVGNVCASNAKSYAVAWELVPTGGQMSGGTFYCVDNFTAKEISVLNASDAVVSTSRGEFSCK